MSKKALKTGIYFGLPDEDYHGDSALSRGGMVDILNHHYVFWCKSNLNPNKKNTPTDAMDFGIRCEDLLLNPQEFYRKYRVVGQDPYNGNQSPITPAEFRDVNDSINMLRSDEFVNTITTGGQCKVTIVWRDEETGILLRMQTDYLHYFMALDYKRFKSIAEDKIKWSFYEWGCDIQQALYTDGIQTAKRLLAANDPEFKVYGKIDKKWLKKFIETPFQYFLFLAQSSSKPYIFEVINFEPDIIENAKTQIREAIREYIACVKKFGTEHPWPATTGKIKMFGGSNMPHAVYYRGAKSFDS